MNNQPDNEVRLVMEIAIMVAEAEPFVQIRDAIARTRLPGPLLDLIYCYVVVPQEQAEISAHAKSMLHALHTKLTTDAQLVFPARTSTAPTNFRIGYLLSLLVLDWQYETDQKFELLVRSLLEKASELETKESDTKLCLFLQGWDQYLGWMETTLLQSIIIHSSSSLSSSSSSTLPSSKDKKVIKWRRPTATLTMEMGDGRGGGGGGGRGGRGGGRKGEGDGGVLTMVLGRSKVACVRTGCNTTYKLRDNHPAACYHQIEESDPTRYMASHLSMLEIVMKDSCKALGLPPHITKHAFAFLLGREVTVTLSGDVTFYRQSFHLK